MQTIYFTIRMQREQAQLLRQQQDEAYLDSLKADQEKVRRYSIILVSNFDRSNEGKMSRINYRDKLKRRRQKKRYI